MNRTDNKRGTMDYRRKLLATTSALALAGFVCGAAAKAEDADRPLLWIELGGQLERVDGSQQPFAPPFAQSFMADGTLPLAKSEKPPLYSNGFEGAIQFQPEGSDWQFSAAIRYGKSNGSEATHQQTNSPPSGKLIVDIPNYGFHRSKYIVGTSHRLSDSVVRKREQHLILDFQAERDVGIGLFGGKASAALGVRFAQFTNRSNVLITANSGPNWLEDVRTATRGVTGYFLVPSESWDLFHAKAAIDRNFKGVGPSLAFNTSVPMLGNAKDGQIDFELGLNGALLFGRQRTKAHEQVQDLEPYMPHKYNFIPLVNAYHHTYDPSRSRSVMVPNAGGFAAISFRYVDAKISLGYRADFFFNAMDGGIDTQEKENRGFFGPYASISVGIGD